MRNSVSMFSISVHPLHPCTCSPPSNQLSAIHSAARCRVNTMGRKWTEYQGLHNWDGLLDPLDHHLQAEILRYGRFVEAAYDSFQFQLHSPFYTTCCHPKSSLLNWTGLSETGYRLTNYLRATSSIKLPHWVEKAANSAATRSNWIGYMAVCEDKKEIARLGRRDIVIAYRGTVTCLEWLENLRAALTDLPNNDSDSSWVESRPMVETGFLSLYSSGTVDLPSLKQTIREEVSKLLHTYNGESLSLTITGHSLGAALATLTAYDIKGTFKQAPLVTVVSFGSPRIGNRDFRDSLNEQGTKLLRIVNSNDIVTKVPGFLVDDVEVLPRRIQQCVEKVQSQWLYSEVGKELKINTKSSTFINGFINMGIHHNLKTYLHLVKGLVSSKSSFGSSKKTMQSQL